MNGEPALITFANAARVVFVGMLSLLWWDVRKVHKVKEEITEEVEGKYLTHDKHTDLCTIVSLEMKQHVSDEIQGSEERIIKAIKDNGKT